MAKKTIPQKEQVLKHLIKRGSITDAQARSLYGIGRLASRIFDLRKIYKKMIHPEIVVKKSKGRTIKFARYVWGKKEAA